MEHVCVVEVRMVVLVLASAVSSTTLSREDSGGSSCD